MNNILLGKESNKRSVRSMPIIAKRFARVLIFVELLGSACRSSPHPTSSTPATCQPACPPSAIAPLSNRRALLVGIAHYSAALQGGTAPKVPAFKRRVDDLNAPLIDVGKMREVLASRYRFKIDQLCDGQATHDAILAAIQRKLIDDASPGDYAVFYFSGHGSTITNTAVPNRPDQTIVPADALLGTPDIRDKELARLFRQAAKKGVHLTAIFDSCHSGSITRGYPEMAQARLAEPYPGEVNDPGEGAAADLGVLTLSAARSDQSAIENFVNQEYGGVFTRSLVATLLALHPDTPAGIVFERTRSLMQIASTTGQEPILDPSDGERRQQALFGWQSSGTLGSVVVPVRAYQRATNMVQLQGGFAIGLERKTELRSYGATSAQSPRVQISKILGPSESLAAVLRGAESDFPSGALLEVDRWLPADEPNLMVRMGPPGPPLSQLRASADALLPLRTDQRLSWVADPTEERPARLDPKAAWPTHILGWTNGQWVMRDMRGAAGAPVPLGPSPTATEVIAKLPDRSGDQTPSLFVDFPLAAELSSQVELGASSKNALIALASPQESAHYRLVGRLGSHGIDYAWLRPNHDQRVPSSLPVRTRWVPLTPSSSSTTGVAAKLTQLALRLGKVRAWLKLAPPEQTSFPFHLTLVRQGEEPNMIVPSRSQPITGDNSTVYMGERFAAVLQLDPRARPAANSGTQTRYLYLFLIDSSGQSTLLSPPKRGDGCSNAEAMFSWDPKNPPMRYSLNYGQYVVSITPPAGMDTYILISSATSIPNPCMLDFCGVSGDRTRGDGNPLAELFAEVGAGRRGDESLRQSVPLNWSIEHLVVSTQGQSPAASSSEIEVSCEQEP